MTKHHQHHSEDDTDRIIKTKGRWGKWLSISGIATIAAVIIALPQIKEMLAYGHDMITAPYQIQAITTESAAAVKVVQEQVDSIQSSQYDLKTWQAKTDARLDNMEKLLNRILDNQERQARYAPSPKQNNP